MRRWSQRYWQSRQRAACVVDAARPQVLDDGPELRGLDLDAARFQLLGELQGEHGVGVEHDAAGGALELGAGLLERRRLALQRALEGYGAALERRGVRPGSAASPAPTRAPPWRRG
jgi:hypothetical protein